MKKIAAKIMSFAATCIALCTLAGCASPGGGIGGDGLNFTYPEKAVNLQLYSKSGDTEKTPSNSVTLGKYCANPVAFISEADLAEVKEGAKIYFTVDCKTGQHYRVHNWDWADITTTIYNAATNTPVNATHVSDPEYGDSNQFYSSGTFYINVTSEVKTKLAKAIEFHGSEATFTKAAYLNPEDPEGPEPKNVSTCKTYSVTFGADADAGTVGYLLQVDNDGSLDEDGLKVTVSNLTLNVKVGNQAWQVKQLGTVQLIPDQYAETPYAKSSVRVVIPELSVAAGTEVKIMVASATISNAEKADSILFAIQQDVSPWGNFAIAGSEMWKPAFEMQ